MPEPMPTPRTTLTTMATTTVTATWRTPSLPRCINRRHPRKRCPRPCLTKKVLTGFDENDERFRETPAEMVRRVCRVFGNSSIDTHEYEMAAMQEDIAVFLLDGYVAAPFGHKDFSRFSSLEDVLRCFENKFGLGDGFVVARQAVVFQDGQDFLFEINRGLAVDFGDGDRLPFKLGRGVVFRQQNL